MTESKENDLFRSTRWIVPWGIPLLIGAAGLVFEGVRGFLWAGAFFWAGAFCAVNAARCRRMHCFFTAVLYLSLGVVSVLVALGALELGWLAIAVVWAAGTVLAFLPEWIGKKYIS